MNIGKSDRDIVRTWNLGIWSLSQRMSEEVELTTHNYTSIPSPPPHPCGVWWFCLLPWRLHLRRCWWI